MGSKLESYVDKFGNVVRDGDTVIYKGKEYTVIYISTYYLNLSGGGGCGLHLYFEHGIPFLKGGDKKSPVKETTIVKKEIIPGVYGKVQVFGSGYVSTELLLTKDELAETIKTLQIIHDAMD